jgi:hypothetical protein
MLWGLKYHHEELIMGSSHGDRRHSLDHVRDVLMHSGTSVRLQVEQIQLVANIV